LPLNRGNQRDAFYSRDDYRIRLPEAKKMTKTGTIISFDCDYGSGLATLIVENQNGEQEVVFCENTATIRAFQAAYPDEEIILPGHCVNVAALRGKCIEYQADQFGVLEWFAPVEAEIEI
jgi:hypothetical protein